MLTDVKLVTISKHVQSSELSSETYTKRWMNMSGEVKLIEEEEESLCADHYFL